jgi:GT2 family glycosyltransferase
MKLFAIIVHYDTPEATAAAVAALDASQRRPDGIVVVDNGSARPPLKSSAEVLALPSNIGFGAGANHGIRAAFARGAERVLLVNSDARLRPDAIGRLEAALDENPRLALVGPTILDAAGRVESRGIRYSPHTGRVRTVDAGPIDALSGCVLLAERRALEHAGLFDEHYFYAFEDVDLCRRLAHLGHGIACVPDAIADHDGSLSIGAQSPRRLYFATRNHLRFAATAGPAWALPMRQLLVVGWNLLHAAVRPPSPRAQALAAVSRGVRDYLRGRFGPSR